MNVTLENLGACKKQLRIDIEASQVNKAFEDVSAEYAKHAKLPGFRPGKAPRDMIVKKFEADILEETKKRVYTEAFRTAVKDHNLEVITDPDVEEVQFSREGETKVIFTVEVAPVFELPEYRGLPARRDSTVVSDEDVDKAIKALADRKATYEKVDRAAQLGDFLVVNYDGTCEGKPITDFNPTARGLTSQKNFWLELGKDKFIPGFAEQLEGVKAGEKRTVSIEFPADFVLKEVQGKKGSFDIEVTEVKERSLPALDDEFAKGYKAESFHQLREGVRGDLQNEKNLTVNRSIRSQLVEDLMNRVQFDLPESAVGAETRSVVYNIVAENQQRGVAKELIDQQKEEIYAAAQKTATGRVKASFIFSKIANKEGIKVSNEELNNRVLLMAQHYRMAPEKLVKELQKGSGVREVVGQILHEKVVDFLQQHAKIEDVAAQA